MKTDIRNIGIIAHVDHGKTTLVDCVLKAAGVFRENQVVDERAMDSMDLEREKGITIRAKNASVNWKGVKVNIVDTPGHADFGGEVERILKMVDGVMLLVDAAEGPQAQTRFVLRKALENKLKIIVFVNKIDRDLADTHKVHDEVLELLLELGADEEQFNAPFLYGSARDDYTLKEIDGERSDMGALLDVVVEHVPPPSSDNSAPFQMLVSNLDWSDYVGRIAIGKITGGSVKACDIVYRQTHDGKSEKGAIAKIFQFDGMDSVEVPEAHAGDIAGLAGMADAFIGETLTGEEDGKALPFVAIDPPTIQMQFRVNDGPLAGRDGKFLTARHLRERLIRETKTNVSIEVEEADGNSFTVSGRGELQIAVLVETMRREAYEMLVSRPEVIYREMDGKKHEPIESLWLEVPNDALGDVLQALAERKGRVSHMEHGATMVELEADIPTRGLIGLESFLMNRTSGQYVMSHMFHEYARFAGHIPSRVSGTLVAIGPGKSTGYALDMLQERGRMFIGPGVDVYEGMIIGENPRTDDLPVNPTKTKQLTNIRAAGSDKNIQLEPPIEMSVERAIEYIAVDEYVEATPNHLRLRKKILNATQRKRAAQAEAAR